MNKLDIKDLSMSYDGKVVLDNISFSVVPGEFLSILGPSGCGKTTLLRILIGLLKPTSGSVIKEGTDITDFPSSNRGMGIVFQNYALFENMSVIKNVEYALSLKKEYKSKDAKNSLHVKAYEFLQQLGLGQAINRKPNELSGGQQQRVAIARTLIMNPDIILLDEPMSALDVATRLELRHELKRIQKEYNTTMIYITHDQEEAFALSDRVMVMNNARIEQLDTPENIVNNPSSEYVQEFVLDNLQQKIDSLQRFTRSAK